MLSFTEGEEKVRTCSSVRILDRTKVNGVNAVMLQVNLILEFRLSSILLLRGPSYIFCDYVPSDGVLVRAVFFVFV